MAGYITLLLFGQCSCSNSHLSVQSLIVWIGTNEGSLSRPPFFIVSDLYLGKVRRGETLMKMSLYRPRGIHLTLCLPYYPIAP